jgi:hypothetical protein
MIERAERAAKEASEIKQTVGRGRNRIKVAQKAEPIDSAPQPAATAESESRPAAEDVVDALSPSSSSGDHHELAQTDHHHTTTTSSHEKGAPSIEYQSDDWYSIDCGHSDTTNETAAT